MSNDSPESEIIASDYEDDLYVKLDEVYREVNKILIALDRNRPLKALRICHAILDDLEKQEEEYTQNENETPGVEVYEP